MCDFPIDTRDWSVNDYPHHVLFKLFNAQIELIASIYKTHKCSSSNVIGLWILIGHWPGNVTRLGTIQSEEVLSQTNPMGFVMFVEQIQDCLNYLTNWNQVNCYSIFLISNKFSL